MQKINPYNLKISQLRALVTVAEEGNFSAAALRLELSQSTISHAIANLEEELGVQLLKRGRHGAQLTPIGYNILQQARQVLDLLDSIANEANHAKGLEGGEVKIAAFRSVATNILPSAIARLHSHYPQITLTIYEFDAQQDIEKLLRRQEVDIAIGDVIRGDDIESWELLEDDYIILLPPHAAPQNSQIDWEELARYPLIVSASGSCCLRTGQCIEQSPIPLTIAYRIREDSTMISMVQQGLGAAILPRLAAAPIPSGLQVCRLPYYLSRTLGPSILKNALHSPAVFAFLDALRNTGQFREALAG
ncbi:LysR family transcriptional regulator [Spirulina subsalsa FACHB-351]|uniref:LysR family transcriptional regulator n=1 Tax=Spirulina subsalsa FACHB-351 TaxID=234711 RepID=A0ABT3L822_9CYAN|nr:LysR family transcriptional regulator [Spirulina subsalsa]MCW6037656.1 LysR family transcriptional regulator [Spirulina subsalsa FACHB-351]